MTIREIYEILEIINAVDIDNYQKNICKNMKKLRIEHYNQYKKEKPGLDNPYSTENISTALGVSNVHYKRLENANDKHKTTRLPMLIKLSVLYDKEVDFFLK